MRVLILLFCFCIVIWQPVKGQEYIGDKQEIEQILSNIKTFSNYYINADHTSLVNTYAENAVILPPGTDIIKGKADIRKKWELPEGVKILRHKIIPKEIRIIGKHAYDIGYYNGITLRKDGSEVSWKGKYLIVWIKEDDIWKIYADAWNRID